MNVFNNNNIDKFTDMSTAKVSPNLTELTTLHEAKFSLENYSKAIALYGIRRTGKTVVLGQLWNLYKHDKASYILINHESMSCSDLLEYIVDRSLTLVLVDEVTRLIDFDCNISVVLDYCISHNIKLVVAGTESYLLYSATLDEAFGRFELIHFNPPLYEDVALVHKGAISFKQFCEKGLNVSVADPLDNLIYSTINSIYKSSRGSKNPLFNCDATDFKTAVQTIIQRVITHYVNKLRLEKITLFDESGSGNVLPEVIINELFYTLKSMNIILTVPRLNLTTNTTTDMYYLTVNALYKSISDNIIARERVMVRDSMNGLLFEAAAVTQIIKRCKNSVIYSLVTEDQAEVDLCIETEDNSGNLVLNLIEFKRNAGKCGKHFNHPEIKLFKEQFSKVNCYTVYCVGETERTSSIHIEDFLENLEDYLC